MANNLICCPNCWGKGEKQTLAKFVGSGTISIRRGGHPTRGVNGLFWDETIIVGQDFSLVCGNCQTAVYFHQGTVVYD